MRALLFLGGLGCAATAFAQTPVTQFTAAAGPVGLALDSVGGSTVLYVADESRGNVLKIDVTTGATVATFGTGTQGSAPGQFGRPYGLAVDPASHDLYVAERLNGRVQRINSTTGASVLAWGVNDAAFNASGQNTNPPNPAAAPGHFQEPIGVAADSAGNVYVVDHGNNRVQKFLVHQVAGVWTADHVVTWGTTGAGNGQFDHPYGAAVDATGNVWVADGANGRVQKFDASGNYLGVIGSKGTAAGQFVIATWISFDAAGNAFVTSTNSDPQATGAADINNQWISKFSVSGAGGTFVSRFGGTYGSAPGEFRLPFDAVVNANKAYVSDYYNGRVQVLDLAGTTPPPPPPGTTAPIVTSFTVSTSTATTVDFAITFSTAVTGVDAADFTVTPSVGATATLGNVTGSGATYTVRVNYSGTGTVQLALKNSGTGIVDAANNAFANGGTTSASFAITTGGGTGGTGGSGGGENTGAAVQVTAATGPANGTYRAGQKLIFTVKFSGNVFVSSAPHDDRDDDKAKKADDDDEDDDHDDGAVPFIPWNAAGGGQSADSGRATFVSGSGTSTLTFQYPVHGNDEAPNGIMLGSAIELPAGATIKDGAGHPLTAEQLKLTWAQNPLTGVILVRANASAGGNGKGNGKNDAPGASDSAKRKAKTKLVNLSSRLRVSGDDAAHAVVVGFVVSGLSPEPVLIRAVGPGLRGFGVMDVLSNPKLNVHDSSGRLIAMNQGWSDNPEISSTGDRVGAFKLAPGSRDCGIVAMLAPGAYTAVVSGTAGNGVALVEVYDAGSAGTVATQQLVNLSTRGFVDADNGSLIVGFVVSGDASKRMFVRAVGPALANFGVAGALADPVLEVNAANGSVLARNDNWGTPVTVAGSGAAATSSDITAAIAATGAFPLSAGSKDAALIVTLPPGAYTATITGANHATGATLVEVYELPTP